MQSSLLINSVDASGKAQQKTVTYVNPEADNDALQTFAKKVTALSTNNYVDSKRVDVTATTESTPSGRAQGETVYVTKPIPHLSIGEWSQSTVYTIDSGYVAVYTTTINYDGGGTLSTTTGTISGDTLTYEDRDATGTFSGVITASETDTYAQTKLAFYYTSNADIDNDDGPV